MSFAYGFGLPHWQPLSGAFSPLSLFSGGVQGAFYDPSDPTTLFTDRAGTTPCGTPGGGSVVPVGAMLDKRAAGYSVFFDGSNDNLQTPNSAAFQFGTGDFTIEGWIYVTGALSGYRVIAQCAVNNSWATGWTLNIRNDQLDFWANGSSIAISAAGSITANTWIHVAATRSGTNVRLWINGSSVATATNSDNLVPTRAVSIGDQDSTTYGYPFQGYISNLRVVKGTAVYTSAFTPSGPLSPITGTSLLTCGTSWTGNPAITKNGDARVDGLNPFTASPVGNHAIAANDTTARPELRARVNLLTRSEEFDNAAWVKSALTVTANSTTAPDGTLTADTLIEGSGAVQPVIYQTLASLAGVVSFYVKANGRNFVQILNSASYANFDLSNGTVGSVAGFTNSAISSVGSGWYRISTVIPSSTVVGVALIGSGTATYRQSYTGDGTSGIYIWGAQLTATNEFPANTYQRISDANTYDAVGFPRYLACNGTSSAMSTPGNVNLSGTDKATVFAGVRKLSDGAGTYPLISEFSADWNVNNNCFGLFAGGGAAGQYFIGIKGTTRAWYEPQTYSAPISNVLCAQYNLSGANLAAQIVPRVNGLIEQENPNGSSGTPANFGTYPLFIGARNTSSFFLNGNIYSLIVVGSAVSAGQISATEQWVAGKTGITI